MIKRKIAVVLIVVMLISQLGMGFSFAESKLENESVENQNTVLLDNVEMEQSNKGI
ncbi:hypothetical protein [Aminipila terrae]|uniref:Uncharacterized protein n=1 Tax=Aminipila terrae TaxID=2697030 RepID=A0A6P1MK63_9FIRM|nr:hypothetical protein [Aminipila terrae]QHI71405.1 hypothetical protein Ami3637_02505 [Aminipila terrae]